jgi:hypothetical protein
MQKRTWLCIYLVEIQCSLELPFIGTPLHELGTFDIENKICAQKVGFVSINPLLDYRVMELEILEAQKNTIFHRVAEDCRCIVAHSANQTWYIYHHGPLTQLMEMKTAIF